MKKSSLALPGLFLLLYIVPLGVRPMVIPDETRYAEIPREMLVSGDWIVPHLNGLRYFEKPALGYWFNAGSMMLFGANACAVRFVPALAAGISALLLFLLVRRFGGGDSAGILAAATFLTCIEVIILGVCGTLDSLFSMFITAAAASFFCAYREVRFGKKIIFLLLLGIACGLAFLTKGFAAFALPVVVIVPFMIWEHRSKDLLAIAWVPVITAIVISLPWCVMVHLREGDFWNHFFWNEHIQRFVAPAAGQHPEPFWLYIPVIMGGALPWTALLPAMIPARNETGLKNSFVRFAVCWFLFPFIFFSASRGKLMSYILPCFPPLIILMTAGLANFDARRKGKPFAIAALIMALLLLAALAVLIASQMTGFFGFKIYGQAETWKWILTSAALLAGSGFLLLSIRVSDVRRKTIYYGAASAILMFNAHFIIPDQLAMQKAPGAFLLRHADRIQADTIIVSDSHLVGAVCWYYKRNDIFLLSRGELKYGLGYADSRHRLVNDEQIDDLVRKSSGKKSLVLITGRKFYARGVHLSSKPVFEDIEGAFAFAQF